MVRLALLGLLAPALVRADPSPIELAERLLHDLSDERRADVRFHMADEAQALCEKAAAARPRDPAPRLCIARALGVSDPLHPEACRRGACERAVEELKRARSLDTAGIEAERIASDLGIIFSRLGRFADALAEYDTALKLVDAERTPVELDAANRSVLYGNSAETLMAMGRLDDAIARYRQAEDASAPGSLEWKLAQWGLGVALDRDEQMEKSRQAIARAVDSDPSLARLSDSEVFFEPAGDKFYYLALGHEQSGERKEALAAWNDYLAAQPRSRWAHRARAHIEALKKTPEPRPLAPVELTIGMPLLIQNIRTPQQITATLRDHENDLRACYFRSLRQGSTRAQLTGDVRLRMELHPLGYVLPDARIEDTTISDGSLLRCLEEVARNWRFAAVDTQELEGLIVPISFGKKP
jgi:tetratricopeptide (TPR) repeat protein